MAQSKQLILIGLVGKARTLNAEEIINASLSHPGRT